MQLGNFGVQADYLGTCSGAGIMVLAMAARQRDGMPYLAQPLGSLAELANAMPPSVLEFDIRGQVVYTAGKHAAVEVGEIKTGRVGIFSTAIPQLGVRLSVVSYILEQIFEIPTEEVRRLGWLFKPADTGNLKLAPSYADEIDEALSEWLYSLYVLEL
jgi:hypothetical protein